MESLHVIPCGLENAAQNSIKAVLSFTLMPGAEVLVCSDLR